MKLYNTLTRKKEKLKPLEDDKVRMYNCGPTVYDYAHIGNWRSFLVADFLRRSLELEGYKLKQVMNLTDVGHLTDDGDQGEDKVEKRAKEQQKTAWDIACKYTEIFLKDMKSLNIERPHKMPKATEHIEEMIELVKTLEEKGYTYEISDGIYFDTSEFEDYGKLSGQSLEEKMAGARVCENEGKKNPTDFALWKFSPKDKQRQMEWESPWGTGFPGWHIECSVLSTKYLGQPFDIHTGGVDHIGVHHENEIAQSEAAHDKKMANFWVHVEFLNIKGEKMAKSEGNFLTLEDLKEKGFDPLSFRLLVFSSHYRSKQSFSEKALKQAEENLEKLRETIKRLKRKTADNEKAKGLEKRTKEARENFENKLADDLNSPEALKIILDYATFINSQLNEGKIDKKQAKEVLEAFLEFDQVLGLNLEEVWKQALSADSYLAGGQEDIPEKIKKLAQKREKLREKENYEKADKLREKIREAGYKIKDTEEGIILEAKN